MKMPPRFDDYLNELQELRQETTDESLACLTLPKLTNKLLFAGDLQSVINKERSWLIIWNAVYMEKVVQQLQHQGQVVKDENLMHL